MIVFSSYFNSFLFDKPSHPSPFGWLNFIGLTSILYILRCFLRDEATLLKFTYKKIIIAYTVGNTYMQVTELRFIR